MANGVWRACTPALVRGARAAAAVVAAGLTAPLAVSAAVAPTPSPSPTLIPPSSAVQSVQDTSLESAGVPTQTFYGRSNAVAVYLPAPAGPLAPSGSLFHLAFEHSPMLDGGSSAAHVLVNGQEVGVVPMDPASATGRQVDLRVPTGTLLADQANLVEIRFDVQLAGRAATSSDDPSAFVRLDGKSLLRYQLYVQAGAPPPARLDVYPFPLVGAHGTGPVRIGLVLPQPPVPADLSAAYRLVADLGRREAGQQVVPEAVTGAQLDWLRAGGVPALAVGAIGRLPAADPLLRAAGFMQTGSGWASPSGQAVGHDDGVIAAVTSPWDRRSPIVLVTGESDAALGHAAAALAGPAALPTGSTIAIVHADPAPTAPGPRPGGDVKFPALGAGLEMQGAGLHAVSLPFTAPAVDQAGVGGLDVPVAHTAVPAGQHARLTALFNGTTVASVPLDRANEQLTRVHLRVPGSALRPGQNTLTLVFDLAGDAAVAGLAPETELHLPGAPAGTPGLELLPHPVFDDPAGLRLVLGGNDDALLTGAARVVAALGGRAVSTPAVAAGYADAAGGPGGLLVIGVPGNSTTATRVAVAAGLRAPPPGAAGPPPTGAVRELAAGRRHVLWVDGTGPAAIALAGDALARGQLTGPGATIDATGRVRALVTSAPAAVASNPAAVAWTKVLIVAAACLLVLGVAWQAWRPRQEETS